jgi:apolipoprotein N-acyltransferase
MRPLVRSLATLLLFLASGVLFALSLPPFFGGAYTIIPALTCLILGARRTKSGVFAFAQGMLAGALIALIHLFGGYNTSLVLSASTPFIFLGLEFGLIAIAISGLSRLYPHGGKIWVLGIACFGVAAEWLLTFTPLPTSIAVTLSATPILLQPAALGGIYLLSFLLWGLAAHLSHAALHLYQSKKLRNASHHVVLIDALLLLLLGTNLWTYFGREKPSYTVATLQDYSNEASEVSGKAVIEDLPEWEALAQAAAKSSPAPALIVAPEHGLGSFFRVNDPNIPANQVAREIQTNLVVGFDEPNSADPERPFNSAALVTPEGKTETIHHKLKPFLGEMMKITRGKTVTVDAKTGVGMLICFDTCWPDIVRETARSGATVLAVPTYDPPTTNGVLTHLHASLMPIRAVENNLPIVRADANGKSQIIDGNGQILAESPLWESSVLVATVTPRTRTTLYTLVGDWVVWGSLGMLIYLLGVCFRKFLAKHTD